MEKEVFCNTFGIEINPSMVNTAENGENKAKGLTTDITTLQRKFVDRQKKIGGKDFDEIAGVLMIAMIERH